MKPFHTAAVDDEVRAMISLVNASFAEVPDKTFQLQQNIGLGMQKALVDGWPDDEVERVYAEAYQLYEAQRYDEALPLALHLAVNRPLDHRFMFMAGMILQVLGDPLLAAVFFATLLGMDGTFVPAAFRLAECYASVGQMKESRDIFEVAIDIGRETLGSADDFYALQRLMVEKLRASN
jgi:tetratricopeptide (TPR) repeat protein